LSDSLSTAVDNKTQTDESESTLELNHLTLLLLVTSQFKVLATLDGKLFANLALGALHLQHDLLCRLRLFVENRLCLSSVPLLLPVVPPLTLSKERILALLVLRDFVKGMLSALLPLAERPALLRYIHHLAVQLECTRREKR